MQIATKASQQQAASKLCASSGPRNSVRVRFTVRASSSKQEQGTGASRRDLLAAGASAALIPTLLAQRPALADGGEPTPRGGAAMGLPGSLGGAARAPPLCAVSGAPARPPSEYLEHRRRRRRPPASEYAKFVGYATPPTSYGGYGGNANELPKCAARRAAPRPLPGGAVSLLWGGTVARR